MAFCNEQNTNHFFKEVELFEKMLVEAGFIILKYIWISVIKNREKVEEPRTDPLNSGK